EFERVGMNILTPVIFPVKMLKPLRAPSAPEALALFLLNRLTVFAHEHFLSISEAVSIRNIRL
ncbi:MAG: hypothetical protein M0033_11560, partial [Nitrospiraceae bacterium]|nr:hypothetical protein [Nitrospiraceae bacterium]